MNDTTSKIKTTAPTIGQKISVNDDMQVGYVYVLTAPIGQEYAPDFQPYFTPPEMLSLGVFEGKYLNDCRSEFPAEWFRNATLSEKADPALNYFALKSRQPLSEWTRKGWIIAPDPRGWFQWYCRYFMGRRIAEIDAYQIKRWKSFKRHAGQIGANCRAGDLSCRRKQRQALLQWAHDPFI